MTAILIELKNNVMKKITVGFISQSSPDDKFAWSGTSYKLYESLSKIAEVVWIPAKSSLIFYLYRFYYNMIAKFSGKNYSIMHTHLGASYISNRIDKSRIVNCDILFCFNSPLLFKLHTNKPIIYLADATFQCLYDYYDTFSNFFKANVKEGNLIERVALNKASHIVYSSNWAKNSAINDYGIVEDKISVIEFGANIDEKNIIKHINGRKEILHILFLGVEWERKGEDIAVETCRILNEKGIKSTLHIVGIKELPKKYMDEPIINNIGFLNKNNPQEYAKLVEVIANSDILLLPTKAECAGVAFSEASANQLPIFTYDTGGIANYVENGVNGYRLDLSCGAKEFANKIISTLDNDELDNLRLGCKKMYSEKLNWNVWTTKVEEILMKVY